MSTKTWTLNGEKRWHIGVVLQTATPLHIGSGEFCQHEDISIKQTQQEKDEKQAVKQAEINACIKGAHDLPIIPGSSLKGKLLSWLTERHLDSILLKNLFGEGHDPDPVIGTQGSGGKAEFHDARITQSLTGEQPWPYWRENLQTYIETSTAVEQHTKTALHESLHYTEVVPPGVLFNLNITGVMSDEEAAVLIAALDCFAQEEDQPSLGADNANGYGRMQLYGHMQIKIMGKEEISNWIKNFPENDTKMALESARVLQQSEITTLIKAQKNQLLAYNDEPKFELTLQFNGPFIVNDPYAVKQCKSNENTKTDHSPLLDAQLKPRLPSASLRGALRSQAERIIRTLGGKCCDTTKPCDPLYSIKDLNKLCLACQIFGASGWKTLINIGHFECLETGEVKKQEFVAIDRFHGGGKEGAKFDASHSERPKFKGTLSFSPRMDKNNLSWGKGLLSLVLRDLKEGDITLGFGANKGYGGLETVRITGGPQYNEEEKVKDFRNMCFESSQAWDCAAIKSPKQQPEKTPLIANKSRQSGFHNPYHFIPVKQPDTGHWQNKSELNKSSAHSHAYYRSKTENDQPLYHGRITCRLSTETPLFIGANNKKDTVPAEINNYRLNGRLAIPATSLRGMISSLAEAASNSAMRVLDDGLMSYRNAIADSPTAIGMLIEKEGEWRLIPLALPTLNDKKTKGQYSVPYEYRTMFPNVQAKLKVYLNNAFKDNIDKDTWTESYTNKVYYLNVPPSPSVTKGYIPESELLRKPYRKPNKDKQRKTVFVIGQKPSTNAILKEKPEVGLRPGILRILGGTHRTDIPNTKKHEIFIPIDKAYINNQQLDFKTFSEKEASFLIPSTVINRFNELAGQATDSQKEIDYPEQRLPYHLKGMHRDTAKLRLQPGDLVYFKPDKTHHELVEEISFSSIWRGRVETNSTTAAKVYSFIPKELIPLHQSRTKISPAELLFGVTEINKDKSKLEENALAFSGKVRISAGSIPESSDDALRLDKEITLKALSTPKLPSPSLYFKAQNGNAYITKKDLKPDRHMSKGRKYYLHPLRNDHGVQKLSSKGIASNGGDSKFPWETYDKNNKPELKVKIKPIKANTLFDFHLDFYNLSEWELGLLCYALRPTDDFRHRLGMGKPIGLGGVKIDILKLQTIDRSQRYAVDEIGAGRFNQNNWLSAEKNTEQALVPEELRKTFTTTMDNDIFRALELLGDPQNIHNPVHYPQVQDSHIELENYQWFMSNDDPKCLNKQTLTDLTKDADLLPTLIKHR